MKHKKIIVAVIVLILASLAFAATTKYMHKEKTIYTGTATHYDSTAWFNVGYAEWVQVATAVENVDSCNILIRFEGKLADHIATIGYDTVVLTRESGTVTPGTYSSKTVRSPSSDSYPGFEKIRAINRIFRYTNGASDTDAYINQYLILR